MKTLRNPPLLALVAVAFIALVLVVFSLRRPGTIDSGSPGFKKSLRISNLSDQISGTKSSIRRTSSKTAGAESAADAKGIAARLISLAAKSMSEGRPTEPDQSAMMEMMQAISRFNSAQFKLLVGEISESAELDDNTKAQTCGFVLTIMANTNPIGALDILGDMESIFKGNEEAGVSVVTMMEAIADVDPTLAADWLSQHPDICGEGIQLEIARSRILKGAARQDPALAFTLMDQMKVADTSQAMMGIVSSAVTNQERANLISAMRRKSGQMGDSDAATKFESELLAALGQTMSSDPSEKTEEFLKFTDLSDTQRKILLETANR